MLTKAMYDYLKADLVLDGVWETIVKESPIIQRLPFKPINNDIVKYNLELTMPTVDWVSTGEDINESTGTISQRTTNVYTVIGDAYTDKARIAMNPDQNPEAVDIEAKAKAMAYAFETAFILGQTSTSSSEKEFKGILRMLAEFESSTTTDIDGLNNSQAIPVSATSGALTMPYMDELIDAIKPGKPDMLLMSKRARRKLNAIMRASGTSGMTLMELKEFGIFVPSYDTIPIFVSDFVPDNIQNGSSSVLTIASYAQATTRTTDYDNTVIFAAKLGTDDLCGLQAGGITHERETFLEKKNAIANRFSWNVSAMCKKKYSLAALFNINPDS